MTQAELQPAIPQLPSGDLEKTERFFVDHLGFEVIAKLLGQKFLSVQRGLTEIHFWLTPSEEHARRIGSESSCYIRVRNIQLLFEELRRRQVPFRYELARMPWGMNEMQIDDPFGNAIRFGEPSSGAREPAAVSG